MLRMNTTKGEIERERERGSERFSKCNFSLMARGKCVERAPRFSKKKGGKKKLALLPVCKSPYMQFILTKGAALSQCVEG